MTRPTAIALALAIPATVAAVAVAMSPVLMTMAVVAIAAAIAADYTGPDLSYLDRPAPAKVVVGRPIRRPMPIRFLPPVDDATGFVDVACLSRLTAVDDEISRLIACYRRAVASRHRTRAAQYAARIGALQAVAADRV